MDPVWTVVDDYLGSALLPQDAVLDEALRASAAAGLPPIQVSPLQGRLLQLLVSTLSARRVLEVGTLGGYSALWMGRALPPGGRLLTLELEPRHAEVARHNLARAGLADRVEVRVGPAVASLREIDPAREGPFDLTFIDADKAQNVAYFDAALRLSRPGSLIVVDNVVRGGSVADGSSRDESVQGSRKLLERMGKEPRVMATAVQTVGSKGYDGFAVARVLR